MHRDVLRAEVGIAPLGVLALLPLLLRARVRVRVTVRVRVRVRALPEVVEELG